MMVSPSFIDDVASRLANTSELVAFLRGRGTTSTKIADIIADPSAHPDPEDGAAEFVSVFMSVDSSREEKKDSVVANVRNRP